MSKSRGTSKRFRYQMYGVVFVVAALLFVAGTIGQYQKIFTPAVFVTLRTDRVSDQLSKGADVKVHGVVVGEVRSIQEGPGYASMRLAIQPNMAARIPSDVSADLLPTTLFGEQYVSLEIPPNPGTKMLASGDVIPQDRSATALEIQQVLGDVMPILQAVRPQDLSVTLTAIAQALQGRGVELGSTLVNLNNYLQRVEPALPSFEDTLSRISTVSRTYSQAAPELLQAMDNLSTTSQTLVQQRAQLQNMLGTVTTTSVNLTNFVQYNQANLIHLSTDSVSTMQLLARYAPEYPCMLQQFAAGEPIADETFGVGSAHPDIAKFTIELAQNHGKYVPGVDTPKWTDTRGPRCYPFVQPPGVFPQYPPDGGPIQDGSLKPSYSPTLAGLLSGSTTGPAPTSSQSAPSAGGGTPELANSPAERQLLSALLAPSMGVRPQDVPDWSSMLVGPLYRGAEVTVR